MEPQGSFGPLLRQERERRQISLDSIAANTKIARSLLEALERDDVSRWPSGIFRKAFIRSYAEAIGLDAEAITQEFLERFPDPAAPRASAPAAAHEPAAAAERPHDAVIVLKLTLPRALVSWFRWPIRS